MIENIKTKTRVLCTNSDVQGVGHMRSIWPSQSLEKHFSDEFDVEINGNPNVENMSYMKQFDIIHFHRHLGPYEIIEKVFKELKEAGIILIMDIDDFWEPATTHPLYQIVKNEGLTEKIIHTLKLADYVTTTTEIFASYIREYNKNVFVIPNAIDLTHHMWKSEVVPNPTDKCRISWIGGSCYDNKTEILTENGFKFFKDLDETEKVACLNPNTNELEYHKPLGYIKEKYFGKLQSGTNSLIDYAVTPNHNMYVSLANNLTQKKINFSLIPSEKVFGKNIHFKKDAIWNGVELKNFIIPKLKNKNKINFNNVVELFSESNSNIISNEHKNELLEISVGKSGTINGTSEVVCLRKSVKNNYYLSTESNVNDKYYSDKEVDMDLWLKFFGFWMAEGWTSNTPGLFQVGVAQKKNNKYLEEIFDTLGKMGFNPTYTKDQFQVRVFDKQLWEYLNTFGKAHEKYIPKEILSLSKRQLNIFLDWYLKGDGSQDKSGFKWDKRIDKTGKIRGRVFINTSRRRAYTVSKKLADNIQEICLKLGIISTLTNRGLRDSIMNDGRSVKAKYDALTISIGSSGIRSRKNPLLKSSDQFESDYDDYVYCVNVPNNIIFVRRNGKTMWCGNSHLHDLKLLEPSMALLHNNKALEDKFQMIMCGFDTRGSITEISPNGDRNTRPIQPHETIWMKFEEILTNKYSNIIKDANYYKWLHQIKKEEYPDQYTKNYVRRWTLQLTQYGKHYDYCDVCLAPIDAIDEFRTDKGQIIKRPNLFNLVKSELKVIEAGMKKKCLIAQDIGIYSQVIEDGKTGILVKDNKDGWYKAMRKVINEPEYRQELANNLHEFVKKTYELEVVTTHRAEIYRQLIRERDAKKVLAEVQ